MTDKQSARKQRQIARDKALRKRTRPFNPSVRVPVDYSRLNLGNSYGGPPFHRENDCYYYTDVLFTCRGCGEECVWTAENQKWYYEEIQGFVWSRASRCLACRIKERERKAEVRRMSEEGKRQKLARQAGATR